MRYHIDTPEFRCRQITLITTRFNAGVHNRVPGREPGCCTSRWIWEIVPHRLWGGVWSRCGSSGAAGHVTGFRDVHFVTDPLRGVLAGVGLGIIGGAEEPRRRGILSASRH